jgi:Transcriptional regulator, AbiEi antitoxin
MTGADANSCRVCRDIADKPDNRPDVHIARAAAGQWGVLSLDELFACGLSRGAVSDRALGGRLHKIHRGVYAVGHPNLPLEGRFLAAVKACGPGAVLSHRGGGTLGLHAMGRALPRSHGPRHGTTRASRPANPSHHHPRPRRHRAPSRDPDHVTRPHPPRPGGAPRRPPPPQRHAPAPSPCIGSMSASWSPSSPAMGGGPARRSSLASSPPAPRPPAASWRTPSSTSSCVAASSIPR